LRIGNVTFFLFLDTISWLGLGYVFWIVVSRFLGASITGETSSSITMAVLLATIFTFGISVGSQRFLGKAFAEKQEEHFREITKFTLLFTIGCISIASILFVIFQEIIIDVFKISSEMTLVIVILSFTYALWMALNGFLISSRKTKELFIIHLISNVIRFLSLIPIIIFVGSSEGIIFSYLTFFLSATILLLVSSRRNIFGASINKGILIFSDKKELLSASITAWIPYTINLVGTQTGVLFIFSVSGAAPAGIYYMAFGIFLALSAFPTSIVYVLFPILSGMKDEKENLLWKAMNASFYIVIPLAVAIAIFPAPLLSIFGEDFISGTTIMSILAITVLIIPVSGSIGVLAFAYGRYRQVLLIGIIPNVAKIILFFVLVSEYSGIGIAASIFIAALIELVIALLLNKKNKYKLPSKKLLVLLTIPILIGLITFVANIDTLASILIVIIASYIIIPRIGIIKYSDIDEILDSIFDDSSNAGRQLRSIARIIFK